MKFIILSLLLISSFGWIMEIQNQCSCTENKLEYECKKSQGCEWKPGSTTCIDVQCNQIETQAECLQHPHHCSYNQSSYTCVPFTSCKNLIGNSVSQCTNQNYQCLWISGNSCIDYDCQIFAVSDCPLQCKNTGTACENISSCEQLDEYMCTFFSYFCSWNSSMCQNRQCSSYSMEQCQFVLKSGNAIQPCYWNQTQCVNAPDASVFNADDCFTQTAGTYHWSSVNTTTGSCIQCSRFEKQKEQIAEVLSKGLILNIIVVGIFMAI